MLYVWDGDREERSVFAACQGKENVHADVPDTTLESL